MSYFLASAATVVGVVVDVVLVVVTRLVLALLVLSFGQDFRSLALRYFCLSPSKLNFNLYLLSES